MAKRRFKPINVADIPPSVAGSILATMEAFPNVDGLIRGVEWFGGADHERMYLRTRDWRWFVAEPIAELPTFIKWVEGLKERA